MPHQNLMRELADGIAKHLSLNDIRILIASGANVNGIVAHGLRPIHYAVYEEDYDCTQLLLVRGCDVNACDDIGYTAVHLSAERGYTQILKLLLNNGARVNYIDKPVKRDEPSLPAFGRNRTDKTSTHTSTPSRIPMPTTEWEGDGATSDYEEEFLPTTTSSLAFTEESTTREIQPGEIVIEEPLRLAIKNDHFQAAELLLKEGANPNQRYFMGSEINLIHPVNDINFLKLLLRHGADSNTRDRSGLNTLMRACKLKDGKTAVELLVNHGADVNSRTTAKLDFKTPVHYAVLGGCIPTIRYLVDQGARINMPNKYQWATPLDYAILKNDPSLVECLMELGADPNRFSPFIGTPLHVACSNELGKQDLIIEILLRYGADPNMQCFTGDGQSIWTPLVEYITVNENKSLKFVQILLTYGAQAVFRLPYLDHRGLLKCLHKLNHDPSIFTLILESGQYFDIQSIQSRRLMCSDHKERLLTYATTPRSLRHYAKLTIREVMRCKVPTKVEPMPIPTTLKLYLKCLEY